MVSMAAGWEDVKSIVSKSTVYLPYPMDWILTLMRRVRQVRTQAPTFIPNSNKFFIHSKGFALSDLVHYSRCPFLPTSISTPS